jgi:undecaprenyl-diphosphatase
MIQAMIASLNQWDDGICIRFSRWSGKYLMDRLMVLASRAGDGYLYPVIGIGLLAFDPSTAARLIPAMLLAFAVELPVQKVLKHSTKRARPFTRIQGMRNLIKPPADFSFPSGHTTAAFLAAVQVGHFYPALLFPCLFVAGIIGVSRIYNGVHYPSDVIAGVILGISSAEIGMALYFRIA